MKNKAFKDVYAEISQDNETQISEFKAGMIFERGFQLGVFHPQSFSSALLHIQNGGLAQRNIVKNDTKIHEYKGKLCHNVLGVRTPYIPTNEDLMANDWQLLED